MNDARSVFGRNVIAQNGDKRSALLFFIGEVRKERLVVQPFIEGALSGIHDLVQLFIGVVVGQPVFSEDVIVAVPLIENLHILDLWPECESEVGRQCPWCRGPSEEIGVLLAVNLETNGERGILDILVSAEVHLEVRKRTGKLRTVGKNIVSFVDISFFIERLEHPPDRFHIGEIHRPIAVLPIDPATGPFDRDLPLLGIA